MTEAFGKLVSMYDFNLALAFLRLSLPSSLAFRWMLMSVNCLPDLCVTVVMTGWRGKASLSSEYSNSNVLILVISLFL